MNRDPIGEAGGLNLLCFVGNNAIDWRDPIVLSKTERRLIREIARKFGVDKNLLSDEIHACKKGVGRGGADNLPYDELVELAKLLREHGGKFKAGGRTNPTLVLCVTAAEAGWAAGCLVCEYTDTDECIAHCCWSAAPEREPNGYDPERDSPLVEEGPSLDKCLARAKNYLRACGGPEDGFCWRGYTARVSCCHAPTPNCANYPGP